MRTGKEGSESEFKKQNLIENAMKKISLVIFMLLLIPVSVLAQADKKKAVYFYSETCVHCEKVNGYFQEQDIYGRYDIQKIEASGPYNLDYLNKFFDAFGVPAEKRGFPVVFFSNKMIFGDKPIIDSFVNEIERSDASEFPTPENIKLSPDDGGAGVPDGWHGADVSIPVLFWAALVDAINPCAFAVLILLVATVISSKGKRDGLLSGLLFSLAVFISYFLMGLGIYKAIGAFNLPQIFSIVIGGIAILIGLANLKDFFWYGKGFVMEVPFGWRPKMQAIIKRVTSPLGAMGAGFVVSLFLLPCTSGPYIVILGLLAQREDLARSVALLAIYNLIFILPMVVITVGMYFGIRAKRLESWRQRNIRLLHLVAGAIMLFIGAYLIYNWL
ncbi:MAG: cytochrome c biogenesis CcdA family protein [Candidatus Moranbacteria bacterium]|nr:cytochrome c biogenesis CcdA family protein [Candidatus Moranbacteria bacterium]